MIIWINNWIILDLYIYISYIYILEYSPSSHSMTPFFSGRALRSIPRLAHRLLDPATLDHLCSEQAPALRWFLVENFSRNCRNSQRSLCFFTINHGYDPIWKTWFYSTYFIFASFEKNMSWLKRIDRICGKSWKFGVPSPNVIYSTILQSQICFLIPARSWFSDVFGYTQKIAYIEYSLKMAT